MSFWLLQILNGLASGSGSLGLEMRKVYSTLGAHLYVVEMFDGLVRGADRELMKVWQKMNAHRIVGRGIASMRAGNVIGENAPAIEMAADAVDIGKTIHAHPKPIESIGLAAGAFEEASTYLPPTPG